MEQCSIVQVMDFYTSGFWVWLGITIGVSIIFGGAKRWVGDVVSGFRHGWDKS